MSKAARHAFERKAKGYSVDISRGPYGELLDSHARECWYFFFSAWKLRARDIKKRSRLGKEVACRHCDGSELLEHSPGCPLAT